MNPWEIGTQVPRGKCLFDVFLNCVKFQDEAKGPTKCSPRVFENDENQSTSQEHKTIH